ncbi:MAG: hypothetical protein GC138_04425 [Gammaproteobacteria bacterium]|nr:hypothetical protein [Gammaproteobacteria bacterium]
MANTQDTLSCAISKLKAGDLPETEALQNVCCRRPRPRPGKTAPTNPNEPDRRVEKFGREGGFTSGGDIDVNTSLSVIDYPHVLLGGNWALTIKRLKSRET